MPRTSVPPTPMIMKLSSTPRAAKKRLGFGDQFVIGPPLARGVAEHRIAFIRQMRG